ncbi:MAG: DUF4118 domain-containing protein [Alphaproteobacteria bacterium]
MTVHRQRSLASRGWRRLFPYAAILLVIGIMGVVVHSLARWVTPSDTSMLFLLPVLWAAVTFGRWPSVFAALAGAGANNFLFFPPRFAFGFESLHDFVTLAAYLVMAVITGNLAGRLGEQLSIANTRSEEMSALHQIGRKITAAVGTAEIGRVVVHEVAALTRARVVLLLQGEKGQGEGGLSVLAAEPASATDDIDHAAAEAALAAKAPVTLQTSEDGYETIHIPMHATRGAVGVLVVECGTPCRGADRRRLLMTLGDQVAVALENTQISERMAETEIRLKADRFRSTLLKSVSHDFRSPLGTILGAATSLLSDPAAHTDESRTALLTTIRIAAERLNRYVHNLLDISRIESGALIINREWIEVMDLVSVAVQRIESTGPSRAIAVSLPRTLPLVRLDFVLIEQVLVNLLDNAAKFSPADARIEVSAREESDAVIIDVFNEGTTVPTPDLERLFDKFYRSPSSRTADGSGLGLAICRGFMAAHGGDIAALPDPARGGMIFRLTFPTEPQPEEPGLHDE